MCVRIGTAMHPRSSIPGHSEVGCAIEENCTNGIRLDFEWKSKRILSILSNCATDLRVSRDVRSRMHRSANACCASRMYRAKHRTTECDISCRESDGLDHRDRMHEINPKSIVPLVSSSHLLFSAPPRFCIVESAALAVQCCKHRVSSAAQPRSAPSSAKRRVDETSRMVDSRNRARNCFDRSSSLRSQPPHPASPHSLSIVASNQQQQQQHRNVRLDTRRLLTLQRRE